MIQQFINVFTYFFFFFWAWIGVRVFLNVNPLNMSENQLSSFVFCWAGRKNAMFQKLPFFSESCPWWWNFGFMQVFHGQPIPGTVAPHPPAMRPRVRARRGQATDPHSIAERVSLIQYNRPRIFYWTNIRPVNFILFGFCFCCSFCPFPSSYHGIILGFHFICSCAEKE